MCSSIWLSRGLAFFVIRWIIHRLAIYPFSKRPPLSAHLLQDVAPWRSLIFLLAIGSEESVKVKLFQRKYKAGYLSTPVAQVAKWVASGREHIGTIPCKIIWCYFLIIQRLHDSGIYPIPLPGIHHGDFVAFVHRKNCIRNTFAALFVITKTENSPCV